MISANRPIINLDLDLLRTFVAVADLNTFAAAAAAVCRTQSAVSQQMQRLEQLVGKELFARHGRNKLLTEHGIQLLGYAREGANKQVISSQADSLIKISRIWADFFPVNTSNQPI